MILFDVNLWVYAFRRDAPEHQKARDALTRVLGRGEEILFYPGIASSFLRLVTNPRIFSQPSPLEEAWSFVEVFQDYPQAVWKDMDPLAWGIFQHMTLAHRRQGNQIPDAQLAALALRWDALFLTADQGFSQYTGLKCQFI